MHDVDFLVNSTIAFGITVGWSMILYPYIRSIKASYRRLLLISVIVSVVILILKELLYRLVPQYEVFAAYFVGIFVAAIIITFLFGYRKKTIKNLPMRISSSSLESSNSHRKRKVRLRHVVLMGALIEDEGYKLYHYFAEKSVDPEVREIFKQLADDELEHKEFFENIHQRWLPVALDKQAESYLVDKLLE